MTKPTKKSEPRYPGLVEARRQILLLRLRAILAERKS